MKATTIRVEGVLLRELERHKPRDQGLSAFVRDVLARAVQRLQLEAAADRYAEFLAREPGERQWLAAWGSADLVGVRSPSKKKRRFPSPPRSLSPRKRGAGVQN